MRIAVVTSPGSVEIRDIPVPGIGEDDVLVRITACGLCTMEAKLYTGAMPVYPVAAGHEVSGRVERIGARAAALEDAPAVGDLVTLDLLTRCGTCRNCRAGDSAVCASPQGSMLPDGSIGMGSGLAEYVRVPAAHVWPVGDIDPVHAAMGEPLACVVHSFRRAGYRSGDRVAVIGGGFMGRLHLLLAQHEQARSVTVVETDPERRSAALDAGADDAVAPEDVGRLAPADVVFVTIASPEAIGTAFRTAADGARLVLFGGSHDTPDAALPGYEVHRRQLTVTGSYSQEPADWRTAAALLRSGTLADRLARLVTSRHELADVDKALTESSGTPVYRVFVEPR
ncbi:dehydrogenase [Streptomyces incarnatus]|uniref:2-deoxy-scyllo-inosamine dehydrogenase n=1 Tax=Streptomyces incarnatus TaxID=665007 RepID=A0ABN4GF60_9ACTN|nr:alcohol dehydrogenase catalytic domain-containing protein [Streptomyces incarnatus]AKJ10263.1 dehydrogenase [Streptomyces incarnatus]